MTTSRLASARFAFLLNMDPERELAGHTTDPFRALEDRRALQVELAPLTRDARILDRASVAARLASGLVGRAFMPTPGALGALERSGAIVPAAPSLAVLRAVNHRAFSYRMDGALGGAVVAETLEDAARAVRAAGTTCLLKRPFGFAGKGRRRVAALDRPAEAFCLKSLAEEGGVGVEPLLDRTLDAAIHGFIDEAGALTRGEPTVAEVSGGGSFRGSHRDRGELTEGERRALAEEAERVGAALFAAGYFGPFGVDALRFRGADGRAAFLPRCEINARYTMGWAIGMGDLRPDLWTDDGGKDRDRPPVTSTWSGFRAENLRTTTPRGACEAGGEQSATGGSRNS